MVINVSATAAAFARLLGVSSALQGHLRVLAHAEAARAIDYSGM